MTTRQRWALVVMGAWTMGSISMSLVATENFYTIDRLLASSANDSFHAAVQQLGRAPARDLLRYLASELNRLYFQIWNAAQIVLGLAALGLVSPGGRDARAADPLRYARWGIGAMLAIVLAMLVYLTPQIVSLGRSLDFVARDPAPPGMQTFWILHAVYTTLELLKLALGLLVAWQVTKMAMVDAAGVRAN